MTAEAEKQIKHFFKDLSAALWSASEDEDNNGSYAGGGEIDTKQHDSVLEAVHVEGVGDLRLPLSSDDALKLLKHGVCKRAPYGHGMTTKLDLEVRCAWQVDASKVTFPSSPDFLSKTVPLIVKKALRSLAIDGDVEAHLYKLLLYEAGGHFVIHRDTEKEPGMFATLIIQLPTQEGFEGGELVVHQRGSNKTFNFSSDSATKFFYSIFYADCEHELLEVTKGKRLCLSFNLVRAIRDGFNMPLDELIQRGYSSRLSRVEIALEPWLQARLAEEPLKEGDAFFKTEKLVIPLEHKYSKTNLYFSGLKENDRILAQILQNCRDASGSRSLDLHLCIFTLHKYGSADEDGGEMEYPTYEFESSTWIDTNDKPCKFLLKINDRFEVVSGVGVRKIFIKNRESNEESESKESDDDEFEESDDDEEFGEPDEEEYSGYTGNEGYPIDYWYHKAVLVIWPKKRWISMACSVGVSNTLDILEIKAKEGDPAVVTMLHEVLYYCENEEKFPSHRAEHKVLEEDLWNLYGGKIPKNRIASSSMQTVASRLLELSLQVGGWETVLRALKLLSAKTEEYGPVVGVDGTDTALAVACVVQKYGWIKCEPFIMELLTEYQMMIQAENILYLALELMRLGCEDAGLVVAKKTLEMIVVAFTSLKYSYEIKDDMIVSMGRILCSFKGCIEDVGVKYAKQFQQMKADVLCSFIVKLYGIIQDEIRAPEPTEGGATSASLLKMACDIITTKDFHQPALRHSEVLKLVETFILLGDEQLLDKLIQAFVDQSREHKEQDFLIALLDSEEMCNLMSKTTFGRSKLQMLIEERIQVISGPAPPFTWCMPRAELHQYPEVEAFLRGPLEKFEYTVEKFYLASSYLMRSFNSSHLKGFSATAIDFRRKGEEIVAITKTRAMYESELAKKAKEQQEELPKLRDRLKKVLTIGSSSDGRGAAMEKGDGLRTAENGSKGGSRNGDAILDPHPAGDKKRTRINEAEHITICLD